MSRTPGTLTDTDMQQTRLHNPAPILPGRFDRDGEERVVQSRRSGRIGNS